MDEESFVVLKPSSLSTEESVKHFDQGRLLYGIRLPDDSILSYGFPPNLKESYYVNSSH